MVLRKRLTGLAWLKSVLPLIALTSWVGCGFGSKANLKEYIPIAKEPDGSFDLKSFTINNVGLDEEVFVVPGSKMEVRMEYDYQGKSKSINSRYKFFTQLEEDSGNLLAGSVHVQLQTNRIDLPLRKGEVNYRFNVEVPDESIVAKHENANQGRFVYFAVIHDGRLVVSRRIRFTR